MRYAHQHMLASGSSVQTKCDAVDVCANGTDEMVSKRGGRRRSGERIHQRKGAPRFGIALTSVELTDDLLFIHVFSCRRCGIRRYRTKDNDKGDQCEDPPEQGTREDTAGLVSGRQEDLQSSDTLDEDV